MKTRDRKAIAALLALIFSLALAAALPGYAAAEEASREVSQFNVVLVIDKSGSLRDMNGHGTDPLGLRYDAMRLFLGLLTETGNNVGVVVFDEEVRYDSGLLPMESMEDKQALIRKAESFGTGLDTNIGAAMLRAVELLKGMEEQNGLPCMILLLTDGKTDFSQDNQWARKQQSWSLAAQALQTAVEEGITINGILLNVDGRAEGGDFELGLYTGRTGGSFEEVASPEDLTEAFKRFYSIVNNMEYSGAEKVAFSDAGEADTGFLVPSFGVEELNVVIERETAREGSSLDSVLDDMEITRPDGSAYEIAGHELVSSRYILVKIPNPAMGKWGLRLKGAPGDSVDVTMVCNASMSAELFSENESGPYAVNRPYRFTVAVSDPGVPEITEEMLRGLGAVLTVVNLGTSELWDYPMTPEGDRFVYELSFPEDGEYGVSATVGSAGFEVYTDEIELTATVGLSTESELAAEAEPFSPLVGSVADMLSFGQFTDDCWELELRELFGVPEDVELIYELSDDYDGALTIEDGVLRARFWETDSARFVVTATNPAGQSADIRFSFPVPAVKATVNSVTNLLKFGQLDGYTWEAEIEGLFEDPKDRELIYALSDELDGALTLEDGLLRLDFQTLRRAEFVLSATDIFGLRAEIPFKLSIPGPSAATGSVSETVKTGLFQEGIFERALDGLFREPKGTPLSYTLSDDLGGAATIENGVLRVNCRGVGKSAAFTVKATDAYELSAELPVAITEKYMTPIYLMWALAGLLGLGGLIGLGVFLYRRYA